MNTQQENKATVGTLENITGEVYMEYNVNSRPPGKLWGLMVLDIARRILNAEGLVESITPADLEQLTEDNNHTGRQAAEIAIKLYTMNTL